MAVRTDRPARRLPAVLADLGRQSGLLARAARLLQQADHETAIASLRQESEKRGNLTTMPDLVS